MDGLFSYLHYFRCINYQYIFNKIVGAILATVISQFFCALLCLARLMKESGSYRLVIGDLCFDFDMLKRITLLGLPSEIQNSIIAFANIEV